MLTKAMRNDIEDTGEILFEDDPEPGHQTVQAAPVEWTGAVFGLRRLPEIVDRMGRRFRLRRTEVVSRSGERTHIRVVYRPDTKKSRLHD
jgi:hypothetical protein